MTQRSEKHAILAVGAWLKNKACLVHKDTVMWSDCHGDLDDPANCMALAKTVAQFVRDYGEHIGAVAHDLHPDFYSTRLALQLADTLQVPAMAVQHHHAHIGVVMAEHHIQQNVIGLALDGVGLGTDGVAWGGELLLVGVNHWSRLAHLHPLALPGNDVAAREPWRMAAAALDSMGRNAEVVTRFAPSAGHTAATIVQQMLVKKLNCPQTTGAGRWFDAAAGALGISVRQTEEAQAAIALETLAQAWCDANGHPEVAHLVQFDAQGNLDLRPVLQLLFDCVDQVDQAQLGYGAACFHYALAHGLAQWAITAAKQHDVGIVALGGGCFYNRLLRQILIKQLQLAQLRVEMPTCVSCGDEGLALGQAWVAQHLLQQANHAHHKETLCV